MTLKIGIISGVHCMLDASYVLLYFSIIVLFSGCKLHISLFKLGGESEASSILHLSKLKSHLKEKDLEYPL